MKMLIFDTNYHLHAYIYKEAMENIEYKIQVHESQDKTRTLQEAVNYAINNSFSCLYLITLDGNINFKLIKNLIRLNLYGKNIILVTNLFAYHKINRISFRAITFLSLLKISKGMVVCTSDPYLKERYYYRALRGKIQYCPDFILDRERIAPEELQETNLPFELPSKKPIIGIYGRLDDKKYISELTKSIKRYINEGNDLKQIFIFAGPVGNLEKNTSKDLVNLSKTGSIIYHPYLLENSSLIKLISISYVVWVVQKDFSGSSGIFTRACAYGIPPIVSKSSTLGRITTKKNLGYCLDKNNFYQSFKKIINLMDRSITHITMKSNALAYSKENTEEAFLKTITNTINKLQ